MRRLSVLCLVAAFMAFSSPAMASDEEDVKAIGAALGYASACAPDSIKETSDEDDEDEAFMERVVEEYPAMEDEDLIGLLFEGAATGGMMAGLEDGKQCKEMLETMRDAYREVGLSGSYWQRVLKAR